MADAKLIQPNPWAELRRHTPARIALGRVGNSLPTDELLRFGLAHAQARDAVHVPLDVDAFVTELQHQGWRTLRAHSAAADRMNYLMRPDHGRRLDAASRENLAAHGVVARQESRLVFVVADGLSPLAVQRHAAPLLSAVRPLLDGWHIDPIVIVEQGRVAIADEIGELLLAEAVVVLIGERPGLSSPDSLGLYLTYAPRTGRGDAERNCISNVRPEGLSYAQAAHKLRWLLAASRRCGISGVGLKDESDIAQLDESSLPPLPLAPSGSADA